VATQAERTTKTRAALLAAARDLFAEKGFAGCNREEIAERAGVTRGALYHHFASKTEVAAAVIEELEDELVARVVAAARKGRDPRGQLRRACHAYLEAATEPAVARIMLVDAPSVLGITAIRALRDRTCNHLLDTVLRDVDTPGDPAVTAGLLLGLLDEAATQVATGSSPKVVKATVDEVVSRLLGTG
jgi:AcrR family transcriptional regulator